MINPLIPYIPIDRCHALASGQPLPNKTDGVALFADISGFTRLAQLLTEELRRRRGAEELLSLINPVYDAIIAVLHQYRGAVIGFAGDGITCWFDSAHGDANGRALACAFAMQEALHPFQTLYTVKGTAVSLSIKTSMAAGPARRFLVGNRDSMVLEALAGQTIERMSLAEKQAKSNEIVVSQELVTALGTAVEIEEWRGEFAVVKRFTGSVPKTPWPVLDHTKLTGKQLRPWVPQVVSQRLDVGGALLGDLRLASPLFLKFDGIDYDTDETAEDKLDRFIQWVQETVASYGGTLLQLTIGDKGSSLYINFGAFQAHEDGAQRAVATALALSQRPEQLSYIQGVQIGLTQGIVWTGECGAKERHTYGVMGNPVNLAARLMGQAQTDTILCDAPTFEATKKTTAYKALSPIRVKGREELIHIYQPSSIRSQTIAKPSKRLMVGRESEMEAFQTLVTRIKEKSPQLVLIEGDAGIGKSTLIEQFIQISKERGVTGAVGAAQSIEQHTPYRVWSDIFKSFFDLLPITDLAERQKRVTNRFNQILPEQAVWLPLLNDIIGLGLPENRQTAALSPNIRQQKLQNILVTLLKRWLHNNELLLVLEDAHWLDPLSWALTEQVVKTVLSEPHPLALIIVTRPLSVKDLGHTYWRGLQQQSNQLTHLSLNTLGDEAIRQLTANTLKVASAAIPNEVIEFVQGRAYGNPFFAEELIVLLRQRQILKIDNGRCYLERSLLEAQQTIPDSLHNLILSRLDQLSAAQQMILKVASVMGRTFDLIPLQTILPEYVALDDDALQENLRALEAAEFTYVESLEPTVTYIFKHIITQEATYQTLQFQQRRQLHASAIRWYETELERPNGEANLPLLVHHSHHAQHIEKERHYACLAGTQAASRFANQDAVTYFTRALELLPPKQFEPAFKLYLQREDVYGLLGKREEQKEDLAMLDTLATQLDATKRITAALRHTRYFEAVTDYANAVERAEESVALAQQLGDTGLEAEAQLRLGEITWRLGRYEDACQILETAVSLATDAGRPHIKADAIRLSGATYMYRREIPQAIAHFRQAYALYVDLDDKIGQANALNNLGFAARNQGHYDLSIRSLKDALQLYQQIGYPRRQALIFHNLAEGYLQLGEFAKAAEYCHNSLAIKRQIADTRGRIMTLTTLGHINYRLGNNKEAVTCLQRGEALAQKSENKALFLQVQLIAGMVAQLCGKLDLSLRLLQPVETQAEEAGMVSFKQEAVLIMARGHLMRGERETAVRLITPYLSLFGEMERVSAFFNPILAYLTVIQTLRAVGDSRSDSLLRYVYTILQSRAGLLQDMALRNAYLNEVEEHRKIIKLYSLCVPAY